MSPIGLEASVVYFKYITMITVSMIAKLVALQLSNIGSNLATFLTIVLPDLVSCHVSIRLSSINI